MKIPSVLSITRKELLSFKSLFFVILLSASYLFLTILLLNDRLILATLTQPYPFIDKANIFLSLLGGLFTAFSPLDTIILFLNAFFVAVNILLMIRTLTVLRNQGSIRLSVGGATIIGFISAGCSSCGFSVLSILGLSTSFSFLPFHGLELHLAALAFLAFSAFYMLKKLRDGIYCKTN